MNEIRKEHISVDCDLSFTMLSQAIKEFIENFKFKPDWFNVEVSIERIITAMEMNLILKQTSSLKIINSDRTYFNCNRDFPKDYWQISGFKDGNQYILYSNGA